MFSAVDKRVAGYTGVDNLTGGYETSGDGLKLADGEHAARRPPGRARKTAIRALPGKRPAS
ncbi:MAG: hypothetical protein WCA12_12610 [Burkholderiales bacterium]